MIGDESNGRKRRDGSRPGDISPAVIVAREKSSSPLPISTLL